VSPQSNLCCQLRSVGLLGPSAEERSSSWIPLSRQPRLHWHVTETSHPGSCGSLNIEQAWVCSKGTHLSLVMLPEARQRNRWSGSWCGGGRGRNRCGGKTILALGSKRLIRKVKRLCNWCLEYWICVKFGMRGTCSSRNVLEKNWGQFELVWLVWAFHRALGAWGFGQVVK
jgi:hypothetical protein